MLKLRSFNICTHLSLFIITNMLSNYFVLNVHLSHNHSMILLFKNMMVQAWFWRALYTVHKWHTAALLKMEGWILLILKVIYITYSKEIPALSFARCLTQATILLIKVSVWLMCALYHLQTNSIYIWDLRDL